MLTKIKSKQDTGNCQKLHFLNLSFSSSWLLLSRLSLSFSSFSCTEHKQTSPFIHCYQRLLSHFIFSPTPLYRLEQLFAKNIYTRSIYRMKLQHLWEWEKFFIYNEKFTSFFTLSTICGNTGCREKKLNLIEDFSSSLRFFFVVYVGKRMMHEVEEGF